MNSIQILLNALGLLFDIIGVYKMFSRIRDLDLLNTQSNAIFIDHFMASGKGVPKESGIRHAINDVITKANEGNAIHHEQSKKWLNFILLGFALQLSACLWPFFVLIFSHS